MAEAEGSLIVGTIVRIFTLKIWNPTIQLDQHLAALVTDDHDISIEVCGKRSTLKNTPLFYTIYIS